jgi:prephenate dehydrogenase
VIERLAVVGDGLIGRSVQLAWKRRYPDAVVVALGRGDDLGALAAADAIVLAAPVDAILALLPQLRDRVSRARFITDVGSTKQGIMSVAAAARLSRFVGGHPMAGGTSSGPTGARADLFDGRPWFLLGAGAEAAAAAGAHAFVADLGARVVPLDDLGEEHDRLVAAISHLPQVVATALRSRVGEAVGVGGLRYSGRGLRDTTRLGDSQASMWAPIFASNARAIAPLLRALAADLERAACELDDREAVERFFARAHRYTLDP